MDYNYYNKEQDLAGKWRILGELQDGTLVSLKFQNEPTQQDINDELLRIETRIADDKAKKEQERLDRIAEIEEELMMLGEEI